uniref:Target of myb1 like 2 membrane trafficking protein n=1 Tax=Oncorhynchus mykiss TaxID=8022 RepID=A0A8C7U3U7_ONCMY
MEFLLGNPYSTPVGQCLEKATDGGLQAEDWTLNMEICDIINETEEGPKDAIRALKKRLSGNRNYREVMLGLTIARLRSELDIVRGNTKVMSEMLTEMVPGQEDSSDLELLQELNRTCRAMQQRVVELISRVSNEEVTEELLHVNDDLNNIFLRYERSHRCMLSEATEDNLIDLTPGSPAVVTSPARTLIQDPTSGPSTLSTQLAGLDVGGVSVSGTLSSLSGHNPGDDFDMFAQTRTSSLADQRKNVKYEDPRALGGLASALDVRQQNATGGVSAPKHAGGCSLDSHPTTIPVSQSSVMDDIEEWLCADVVRVFSPLPLEFDKFLEDRAKVVDSLPSLPGDEPGPPLSAPSGTRKKAERTEDALFAL